jgi:hypothetical protein
MLALRYIGTTVWQNYRWRGDPALQVQGNVARVTRYPRECLVIQPSACCRLNLRQKEPIFDMLYAEAERNPEHVTGEASKGGRISVPAIPTDVQALASPTLLGAQAVLLVWPRLRVLDAHPVGDVHPVRLHRQHVLRAMARLLLVTPAGKLILARRIGPTTATTDAERNPPRLSFIQREPADRAITYAGPKQALAAIIRLRCAFGGVMLRRAKWLDGKVVTRWTQGGRAACCACCIMDACAR